MSTMLLAPPRTVAPQAADALRRASHKLAEVYDDLAEAARHDPELTIAAELSFGIGDAQRAIARTLDPRDDD